MTKLLLVEDDREIVETLTAFLQTEGFSVAAVNGQTAALRKLDEENFDLALVDVTLAQGNGFALCAAIQADYDLPVIFLTASGDEYSVVTGLNLGADDYIGKPFRPRELVSRIQMVLRRRRKEPQCVQAGDIRVDTGRGVAYKGAKELFLSPLEYRLLLVLLNHRGKLLTRERLLSEIWDMAGEYVSDNTLTVYIKRLRDKIEDDPQNPSVIRTVRGLGYKVGD